MSTLAEVLAKETREGELYDVLPDGRAALFYNSGYYGREQLYLKVGNKRD